MVIKGYKTDPVGFFCFGLFIVQTIGMIAYETMMTKDYYDEYLMFRGSQLVQSSVFIAMWYILFFWFASIAIFKHRLMNFFRIRCSYAAADYVQIERYQARKYSHTYTQGMSNTNDSFCISHHFPSRSN